MRGGIQIYGSTIESIRQLRDDKHEVKAGQECGIIMSKFADYKVGDMIQCFESRKINA
jgi:translation initiation factor IF-2